MREFGTQNISTFDLRNFFVEKNQRLGAQSSFDFFDFLTQKNPTMLKN